MKVRNWAWKQRLTNPQCYLGILCYTLVVRPIHSVGVGKGC